jgi:hypothetical protein
MERGQVAGRKTQETMIAKIISGGQTGADRAALDFAISHGISHGGSCPRGRLAEDGVITGAYHLNETPGADPAQRTEWNVRDADATVVLSIAPTLAGGSKKTVEFAALYHKPCLHLSRERDGDSVAERFLDFLSQHQIRILNVAGPRHSEEPEVHQFTLDTLAQVIVTWNDE